VGLGLAHKILDTFEKMDAINPTFELIDQMPNMKIRFIPLEGLLFQL
jgi:hypothetical protein